ARRGRTRDRRRGRVETRSPRALSRPHRRDRGHPPLPAIRRPTGRRREDRVAMTTRELRLGPLAARRLAGSAAILLAVAGVVWLLPRFGIPLTTTRIDPSTRVAFTQRWGVVAVGIAAAFFLAKLLDYLAFD